MFFFFSRKKTERFSAAVDNLDFRRPEARRALIVNTILRKAAADFGTVTPGSANNVFTNEENSSPRKVRPTQQNTASCLGSLNFRDGDLDTAPG